VTAEAALMAGRQAAEAEMLDTCTLGQPSTTHTTDPVTGAVTYATTSYYSGACRVQLPNGTRGDTVQDAGERANFVQSPIVSVPMSVVGVRVGDIVTITGSQLDPDLVGTVMRVTAITRKSFLTARRLFCEEVTG
jgi:hypothetical protein